MDPALVTDRLEDLLEDESISMVLEAMGGVDPGLSYAQACLRAGNTTSPPTRKPMAKHWEELNAAAGEGNVTLSFGGQWREPSGDPDADRQPAAPTTSPVLWESSMGLPTIS